MYLKIDQIQNMHMMCNESVYATIANHFGKKYELLFNDYWDFNYISGNDEKFISGEVEFHFEELVKSNANDLLGIVTLTKSFSNTIELYSFVKCELRLERPVLVFLDYKNYSQSHETGEYPFLITGFEEDDSGIFCIDIHGTKTISFLEINRFLSDVTPKCIYFNINSNDYLLNHQKSINDLGNKLKSRNIYDSIRKYASKFKNFDFSTFDNKDEFYGSILHKELTNIGRSRQLYSLTIDYFYNITHEEQLTYISNNLKEISQKWFVARALIAKSFYRKSIENRFIKVSNIMFEIAQLENELINQLEQIKTSNMSTYYIPHISKERITLANKPHRKDIYYVDISNYLNNKAFACSQNDKNFANFTESGRYFLFNNLPCSSKWEINNMSFKFPYVAEFRLDNISCSGEEIQVINDIYKYILILGCSVHETCSGYLSIKNVDNTTEKLAITLPDGWSVKLNEKLAKQFELNVNDVAWIGNVEKKQKDGTIIECEKMGIYALAYKISKRKIIKSITLPDYPNMHIFAITLYKP